MIGALIGLIVAGAVLIAVLAVLIGGLIAIPLLVISILGAILFSPVFIWLAIAASILFGLRLPRRAR